MSVTTENAPVQGQTTLQENRAGEGVYASLFEKINLAPASHLGDINDFLDDAALSEAPAAERLTAAMQVFMERIRQSGQRVEKLDKTLIDHHIAELDFQISRQLDAVMHHQEFQQVESLWRGLKQLVDNTDYRQNVKTEILDVAKDDLRQDFEDAPELIQSGLYWHTYTAEYDTPGGEPIGSVISAYEFDASPQDVALLRNISRVSAAAHMPFIGAVGPAFFLKETMEEVAAIKDIGNYFDRAEYIRWKAFRETDDARYIGLVMPRVLGRLPYGPDTVPVRSFNYVEQVKGPDHEKYLWTSAAFSFASNMVKSFVNNGWCVQIRGPQAGGAVKDLPIHLYDLGTGNGEDPSEVMIRKRGSLSSPAGLYPAVVLQKSRLRLLLLGQLRAETGAVRYRRRHRQQPYQRASALHLPAVAHRALPEDDPAREYRHHQGPASAGAGAEHLGAEPGDRNDRPRRRAAGLPSAARCQRGGGRYRG